MNKIKRFFSKNAKSIEYSGGVVYDQSSGSDHIAMLFYFIGLTSQLAEVDSSTNEKEMDAIYSFFPNFLNVKRKVDFLYKAAVAEQLSVMFLTSKINKINGASKILCKEICIKLLELADADAPVNNLEFNLIAQIASDFGFSEGNVEHWLEKYIVKFGSSDYEILNLNEEASLKEVNDAYRELAMKFHPDKLFSCNDIHPICMEAYKKRYDMISNAYKNLKSTYYSEKA
jgi:DnaJ-domain-containing protein 1